MEQHVGIDVSLELSSLCVLDPAGKPICEAKVPSEPEALVTFLSGLGLPIGRVGLRRSRSRNGCTTGSRKPALR